VQNLDRISYQKKCKPIICNQDLILNGFTNPGFVGLVVAQTKASWRPTMFRVAEKKSHLFAIVFSAIVFCMVASAPVYARIEYEVETGWTEGDPGDGLEAVGGGSESYSNDNSGSAELGASGPLNYFPIFSFDSKFLTIVPVNYNETTQYLFILRDIGGDWGKK
jgi:hypothetical protein